ncbi:zinc transporter ZIP10-like isoform X1 [Crassostrea virginica]
MFTKYFSGFLLRILLCTCVITEPRLCTEKTDTHASLVEKLFTRQLFKKYGNESAISFKAFESLFQNLEIGGMHHNERQDNLVLPEFSDEHHNPSNDQGRDHLRHRRKGNTNILSKCLFPVDMINIFGFNALGVITIDQFHHMCPVIMVQLDSGICPHTHAHRHPLSDENPAEMEGMIGISPEVWGYSSAAIATISLLGLLSVLLIPCLQKVFLNTILQFLVALAVGALSGDAMLHLIPHVFADEKEGSGGDNENVYKGLCGLAGIYSFFIFGRLQGIYMNRKIKEQNKGGNNIDITIKLEPKDQDKSESAVMDEDKNQHKGSEDDKPGGHGHDHPVPRTLSALVWRVVVGDGIHNFSDGIAVGVAFASSVTGGFSTSVAVLCHELPHEMGDFAVLLKNGMTIRQALLCNCLSSVLSFIGMAVGLAVGNLGRSNLWIFSGIAGMFLYISLVDLIPEMSLLQSGDREKSPFCQLLFQLGGTSIGITIMLIIALYEHQLNSIFQ